VAKWVASPDFSQHMAAVHRTPFTGAPRPQFLLFKKIVSGGEGGGEESRSTLDQSQMAQHPEVLCACYA